MEGLRGRGRSSWSGKVGGWIALYRNMFTWGYEQSATGGEQGCRAP